MADEICGCYECKVPSEFVEHCTSYNVCGWICPICKQHSSSIFLDTPELLDEYKNNYLFYRFITNKEIAPLAQ